MRPVNPMWSQMHQAGSLHGTIPNLIKHCSSPRWTNHKTCNVCVFVNVYRDRGPHKLIRSFGCEGITVKRKTNRITQKSQLPFCTVFEAFHTKVCGERLPLTQRDIRESLMLCFFFKYTTHPMGLTWQNASSHDLRC